PAVLAFFFLAQPATAEIAAPEGQVLVTLGGAVAEGNRGASTEDDLTVLGKLGAVFETGIALDAAMLAALPAREIATTLPGSDVPATFSGPTLAAVMTMAGAEGQLAIPFALDGYQAEIPWEMIEAHDPILATHLDGAPLAIGGLGPTMTVFPVVEDAEVYESFLALQVWATVYLGIE
ncbi:MAG: hypothetical protein AAF264_05325, partial [Pseudomonadota bacterium]